MASSSIKLEISYSGPYSGQKNGNVAAIDMKFRGVKEEIFASIDTSFKVTNEQILNVTQRSVTGDRFVDLQSASTFSYITIPIELIKTIQLSAKIFRAYESNCKILYPDGSIKGIMRRVSNNLPISTILPSIFEKGKYYRIKVVNTENRLQAHFILIDKETARAERREQEEKLASSMQQEMDLINSTIARSNQVLGEAPGRGQELQGLPYLHQAIFLSATT